MTRTHSVLAGLLVLSGCAPSNDLSDEEHVRTWANTASAVGVFSHGYEVVATADAVQTFPDPACPGVTDDGTTMVISGDCTNSSGAVYHGSATLVRSGGDRSVTYDGYGADRDGTAVTLDGTLEITELTDGTHDFVADYTQTGGTTTTFDYTGNVEGTYDGPSIWNGSGTVSRDGFVGPNGTVEATTVDQRRDSAVCDGTSLSGSTTIIAGDQTAVVTYDGATACDADDSAQWSLDGVDQGLITGVTCSVSRGSRSGGALALSFLLAAFLVWRVRRSR